METKEEKQKQKLFSFAKMNKYFIFPFLCPIYCMLGNLFIGLIIDDKGFKNKEFSITLFICFSYSVGGLLYFISSIRTKTAETKDDAIIYREKEREKSISSIKFIYNDGLRKNRFKIFGILFIMSSCLSLCTICSLLALDKNVFQERLYFLFFIPLFSKVILKDDIFKHQIVSLIIAVIGMIFLFIPIILVIGKEDIIINILLFITCVGYSLHLVLTKFLTHNYYISPYLCLLFLGLLSFILTFFGFVIYSLIKYQNLSYISDSLDFSEIESGLNTILYFFGVFIFGTILQIFSILVIYYFSPTLYMVTDIISPMLLWIIQSLMKGEKLINVIFYSLGYLIVLFASLIYNEIIICNFYDLNKDTKKCLEERQTEELISLRETENQIKYGNQNQKENNDSEDSENEEEKPN